MPRFVEGGRRDLQSNVPAQYGIIVRCAHAAIQHHSFKTAQRERLLFPCLFTFFCRSLFKRLALALSVVTLDWLPDEMLLRQAGMQANERLRLSTTNKKANP
jgi:hypothetical protein